MQVSNHGGRQMDHAVSAFDVLPQIAAVVRRRVPLVADGAMRSGTDVLKAICLGADAVMIGRPMLWALALGGQRGVEHALEIVRDGLRRSMALCGVRNLSEAREEGLLVREGKGWDPLYGWRGHLSRL